MKSAVDDNSVVNLGAAAIKSVSAYRAQHAFTLGICLFSLVTISPTAQAKDTPQKTDSRAAAPLPRLWVLSTALEQCDNPALTNARDALHQLLETSFGGQVLPWIPREPTNENEQIKQLKQSLASAKDDFLWLRTDRAEASFRAALKKTSQLLIADRWPTCAMIHSYLARIHEQRGQRDKAGSQYLEILRLQPDFVLSPTDFPESSRTFLEEMREKAIALPRVELSVNGPAQAQVSLNGFVLGTAPLKKQVAAGTYEMTVQEPNRAGYTFPVTLTANATIDAATHPDRYFAPYGSPCLSRRVHSRPEWLANLLSTDQVIIMEMARADQGEQYIVASIFTPSTRTLVRSAAMRMVNNQLPPLDGLAQYLLTGNGEVDRAIDANDAQSIALANSHRAALQYSERSASNSPSTATNFGSAMPTKPAPLASVNSTSQGNWLSKAKPKHAMLVLGALAVVAGTVAVIEFATAHDSKNPATANTIGAAATGLAVGSAAGAGLLFYRWRHDEVGVVLSIRGTF